MKFGDFLEAFDDLHSIDVFVPMCGTYFDCVASKNFFEEKDDISELKNREVRYIRILEYVDVPKVGIWLKEEETKNEKV